MTIRPLACLLIPVAALTLGGCNTSETAKSTGDGGASAGPSEQHSHAEGDHEHGEGELEHAEHGHEGEGHGEGGQAHPHGSEGPHGGGLVELGGGDYHAEVVRDEPAGEVAVYLLGKDGETQVAIAASEVTVNLRLDGQGKQFQLAAKPQQQDPQDQASRFVSSGDGLGEALSHEHADAQLVVTIDDKQYRGAIEHPHGREGHDHP